MKTIALQKSEGESAVTVELTDTELTVLVALVEQGRKRLHHAGGQQSLHQRFDATAQEFCSLLGHLELLEAND
ncbi:MAG: hypothetical protein ABJ084_09135 [Halioglobus sp.]